MTYIVVQVANFKYIIQYEGVFNTIEQVVFIEQNQFLQTRKMEYYLAINLKKTSYSSKIKIILKSKVLIYGLLKCSHEF